MSTCGAINLDYVFLTFISPSPPDNARLAQPTNYQLIWDDFTERKKVRMQRRGNDADCGEGGRYTASQPGTFLVVREKTGQQIPTTKIPKV